MKIRPLYISIIGYVILGIILASFLYLYILRTFTDKADLILIIFALGGAIAIIDMTLTDFFLWKDKRYYFVHDRLGPVGHALACGYCFGLWLSAAAISLTGISFFPNGLFPRPLHFFLSWWTLGAISILLFEILSGLWFKKLVWGRAARALYKDDDHDKEHTTH